jgi:hypothetical protein
MRWMKFVVIILGLLIICGVGLLGYGFYKKTSDPGWKLFGSAPSANSANIQPINQHTNSGPMPVFGDIKLKVAPDCFIRTAHPRGDRLIVTLGPKNICDTVYVMELSTGRTLGTISSEQ